MIYNKVISPIKINIAANLLGKFWSTAIAILLIPLYIKFLGIESYGLIGFYSTLLGSLAILDLGLSTALNRELAMAKAINRDSREICNLVFTLECIYWAIGLVIALGIILLAPVIASHWIKTEHISITTVNQSIILMGIVMAFQWPISIYTGGLLGIEKQILYNLLMIIMSTLRAGGILVLFIWIKPSLQLFFIWQAAISLLYVVSMRIALWNSLPKTNGGYIFSRKQLSNIWKFALGMTSISAITFFLSQIDKIVLSKLLPLTLYGYYILSFTVASSMAILVTPIYTAIFPRLSALASLKNYTQLSKAFHDSCKLSATLVFPVGLLVIFFTPDILFLWTRNINTVKETTIMVQILTMGSILNSLMIIPIALLYAFGNTKFVIYQNTILSIVLVPLLFWWTNIYGAVGATFVWVSLNVGLVVFTIPLIHKIYFKGEIIRWYINDTLLPLLPPLVCILIIKWGIHIFYPNILLNFFIMASIAFIVVLSGLLFHPSSRQILNKFFNRNMKV